MGHVAKYRQAFLKANWCTAEKFERSYVKFMDGNPAPDDYRKFAKRWEITIHPGLGDKDGEALLSVNIAVIKVLATNEIEADLAIQGIFSRSK